MLLSVTGTRDTSGMVVSVDLVMSKMLLYMIGLLKCCGGVV